EIIYQYQSWIRQFQYRSSTEKPISS
ncbi:unnamed protein product, partial [Rotaria sordida]